jgi:FKBP-type peptidyl-prolyl cis-trans isomerase
MKKIAVLSILMFISCKQQSSTHPPVGGILSEQDLDTSKNRAKNLNQTERAQIQDWINNQNEKFYPMGLNYWVNIENLSQKKRKSDGERISYRYEIYDFDNTKFYETPTEKLDVQFGKFEELKAVEDILRYLDKNQEVTLLIPSVLAYGTYGDNDKIPNDMPLIIKLKVL